MSNADNKISCKFNDKSANRILITGGAGFIGSHLAEHLLAQGKHVTVIDTLSTGRFSNIQHLTDNPNFHFAIDTVTNEVVMDRLVSDCDMIFHLAAAVGVKWIMENPVQTLENNFLGVQEVLKIALRYRAKVLITSTSEVYGKGAAIPFNETDDVVLGPTSKRRWAYAASKMVNEFLALSYYREMGLPVIVTRLFNTVGPRQTGHYGMVIPRFVKQALSGEPLTVYGEGRQSRCFLHVHDAVRALAGLGESTEASGQVLNIGSVEEISIADLANKILDAVDASGKATSKPASGTSESSWSYTRDGRIAFIPMNQVYDGGFEDMEQRYPDLTRIQKCIGWAPKLSLSKILEDVIADMSASSNG